MSVRLFYVDESYDSTRFCLSAIGIRHVDWRDCFQRVRQHRSALKKDYGIYLRKEVHAQEFVSGRGRISTQIVSKHERSKIFEGLLRLVASLPNVMVINICLETSGRKNPQLDAWDRLLNRIERTLLEVERRELRLREHLLGALPKELPDELLTPLAIRLNAYGPRALIFADEGAEIEITRTLRKMNAFNPIPSRFGEWPGSLKTRNIPVQRVIEDPVFKPSHQSYFIQLADCVAFALLKREVRPTPLISKYGIDQMFERNVAPACLRRAARKDPLGIVRK
jgi:hypothetical protein